MLLARLLAIKPRLVGRKLTVKKINMEGIKPPYLLFATHASLLDLPVMYTAVKPYNANNVVAIDAFLDVGDYLMRQLGCIPTRKFIKDYNLIRNLRYCAKNYKTVVCMYPEARYSLDGTTSYLPASLGKLCKVMKIPVVVLRMYGTFISSPQWNKKEQKLPLEAELECIATVDEVASLSVDELNERIRTAMQRDDFAWQKQRGIHIKNPNRAQGLHNILYRCPHCNTEYEMYSEGTRLWCNHCGKAWQMSTLSELNAEEGETEFTHIPDWVKWERALIREEVRSGRYRFEDEVEVHTLPNAKQFYHHGKGKLVQSIEGTCLECTVYGEERKIFWAPTELESVHIEYDYPYRKIKYRKNLIGDCVDISTPDESYWAHPVHGRDRLTKISFATEEIYALALEKIHAEKN